MKVTFQAIFFKWKESKAVGEVASLTFLCSDG